MVYSTHALLLQLEDDLRSQGLDFSSPIGPDCSARQAAAVSIHNSLLKKLRVKNSDKADSAALAKFLACNEACKNWTLQCDSWEDELVGSFKRELYNFFNPSGFPLIHHPFDILDDGCLGSGASIRSPGGDSYSKLFSSDLSVTSSKLYNWYGRYISRFPEWNSAEVIRLSNHGSPFIAQGSRLSFVPKYVHTSRSICTEPVLNMFYQLGLGKIFLRRLRSFYGITIENQPPKNRELARLGSLNGSFSTIDLESASDSISVKMLQEFLPKEIMDYLLLTRSPVTTLPNGEVLQLHMISSMGNGFTFPLQTIIFMCAVSAVYKCFDLKLEAPYSHHLGNYGVFGDDIVVVTSVYRRLCRLLHILGFKVNADKSFAEGPFRESCGYDYHSGMNIRGVYVKSINTPQTRSAVINQLNLFSARTGIMLRNCVQYLYKRNYHFVPRYENDDAGIKVPFFMVSPHWDKRTQSVCYRKWENISLRITIGLDRLFIPYRHKLRTFNPSGLFVSFIAGWISGNHIGVRQTSVRYATKRGISPWWDYIPTDSTLSKSDWQRWETAVYINVC